MSAQGSDTGKMKASAVRWAQGLTALRQGTDGPRLNSQSPSLEDRYPKTEGGRRS